MNGYQLTLTAAVADEHRRDLLQDAARSRMIADLPDRGRHQSPRYRAPWWSRVTSLAHRNVPASA